MKKSRLLKDVNIRREVFSNNGEYTLLNSPFANKVFDSGSYDGMVALYDIFTGWDDMEPKIPFELGIYLEELVFGNLKIGIHRSGAFSYPGNPHVLECIIEEGLINLGDLSSGSLNKRPQPNKTISFVDRMLNLVMMLKSSYKGAKGSLLVGIPKEYFKDGTDVVLDEYLDVVYEYRDSNPYVKSEYILGYLERFGNELKFYTKEEIIANKKALN